VDFNSKWWIWCGFEFLEVDLMWMSILSGGFGVDFNSEWWI
jgi:hypothetical protein